MRLNYNDKKKTVKKKYRHMETKQHATKEPVNH